MNEAKKNQKCKLLGLCTVHDNCTPIYRNSFLLGMLVSFLAGIILTGLFIGCQRSQSIGGTYWFHSGEYRKAAATIGQLATELERERKLNRELRDYNIQARAITGSLTDATERNVRNLQEAIALISEIRTKLKILADFYTGGNTGSGNP